MPRYTINLNGRLVPAEDASVSVFDHGFLFGDSVYEVVRTHHGVPFTMGEHLARLWRSAERIGLAIPLSRRDLTMRIVETLRAAKLEDAYVRIVVTRGVGEVDIDPASCKEPNVFLIVKAIPAYPAEYYARGIDVHLCGIERTSRRATDPGIKSGNYLNSVLAIMETRKRGSFEGIMLNGEGHLTEGTTSNVFFVRGGAVHSPAETCGILLGITRGLVFELATGLGIAVREGEFRTEDLAGADESFITSTTRGVMPIASFDGRPVKGPSPGPVTRRLMDALGRRMEEDTSIGGLDAFVARLG